MKLAQFFQLCITPRFSQVHDKQIGGKDPAADLSKSMRTIAKKKIKNCCPLYLPRKKEGKKNKEKRPLFEPAYTEKKERGTKTTYERTGDR